MLLSISVILLTISLYFLMGFFMQERQDNQLQQELQELMQKREDESEEDASGDSLIEIDAGILALHEENPDCIGWLTIDGTRIDYPVMYRPGDKIIICIEISTGNILQMVAYFGRGMCTRRFGQSDHIWTSHEQWEDVC